MMQMLLEPWIYRCRPSWPDPAVSWRSQHCISCCATCRPVQTKKTWEVVHLIDATGSIQQNSRTAMACPTHTLTNPASSYNNSDMPQRPGRMWFNARCCTSSQYHVLHLLLVRMHIQTSAHLSQSISGNAVQGIQIPTTICCLNESWGKLLLLQLRHNNAGLS